MLSGDKTPDTLASLRRTSRKPAPGASTSPSPRPNPRPTQSDLFAAFEAAPAAEPRLPAEPQLQVEPPLAPAPAPPAPLRAPAPAAADPNARRIWSVRALVTDIRAHVERGFNDLWVEGEIFDCRPAPSGPVYFT